MLPLTRLECQARQRSEFLLHPRFAPVTLNLLVLFSLCLSRFLTYPFSSFQFISFNIFCKTSLQATIFLSFCLGKCFSSIFKHDFSIYRILSWCFLGFFFLQCFKFLTQLTSCFHGSWRDIQDNCYFSSVMKVFCTSHMLQFFSDYQQFEYEMLTCRFFLIYLFLQCF